MLHVMGAGASFLGRHFVTSGPFLPSIEVGVVRHAKEVGGCWA
jgi:hypothetical protein